MRAAKPAADAIALRKLRELRIATPTATGRPAHLAAASGLVESGGAFHVVADDELHVGVFPADSGLVGKVLRAFPGDLPDAPKPRKKAKPDGEAIVALPPFAGWAHGALLALGSGSRPNRCRGALLPLDARGAWPGDSLRVDLAALYASFGIDKLNVEGACVDGGEIALLQRGNRGGGNKRIRLPLARFLDQLADGAVGAIEPLAMEDFDLGHIEGVALGFTDAAALPEGRMLFTAVAEDTGDNYHDGPCGAAAIGVIGPARSIEFLGLLRPAWKVEGVCASVDGRAIRLHLVTDADDADVPALLLAGEIPITW